MNGATWEYGPRVAGKLKFSLCKVKAISDSKTILYLQQLCYILC